MLPQRPSLLSQALGELFRGSGKQDRALGMLLRALGEADQSLGKFPWGLRKPDRDAGKHSRSCGRHRRSSGADDSRLFQEISAASVIGCGAGASEHAPLDAGRSGTGGGRHAGPGGQPAGDPQQDYDQPNDARPAETGPEEPAGPADQARAGIIKQQI